MRPLLLAPLLLTGCTWISSADVAEQKKTVDHDGDGYDAEHDCDDDAATVYPDAPEVWYDGLDEDCGGDNDYDADGDGYVPDAWLQDALADVGGDTIHGGECDDEDAAVHPGAVDTQYDGVDTDCGGEDDYDADGDHYVPDAYVGLATTYVAGSGALPGGDCDDTLDKINPGAADTWYDGKDSDCSGNDDYDRDSDGHVLAEDAGLVTQYVDGSGHLPADDCDDLDATVYGGATEVWYDGVDQDCDGGDDYDQDGDGYAPDADCMETTVACGDCDDTAPSVHPRATELEGDGADSDCDGGNDSFRLSTFDGWTFAGALSPILLDDGDELWLSFVATQGKDDTTTWYQTAFAFAWPVEDIVNDATVFDPRIWAGYTADPEVTVTEAHSAMLVDGVFYGALGLLDSGTRSIYLAEYTAADGATYSATLEPAESLTDVDDVSIYVDDTEVYVLGCAATEPANWARLDHELTTEVSTKVDEILGNGCALEVPTPTTADVFTTNGVRVDDWAFDPSVTDLSPTRTTVDNSAFAWITRYDAADGPWYAFGGATAGIELRDPDGGLHTIDIGTSEPIAVDLWVGDTGDVAVAWVDTAYQIHVASGPLTHLTSTTLEADFPVDQVAVHDAGGTLVVVGTSNDGVVFGAMR